MPELTMVPLDDAIIAGAVSIERNEQWVKPWRIPFAEADLFPPKGLLDRAEIPAGVRLRFESDTPCLVVEMIPSANALQFDCVIDGELVSTATTNPGDTKVAFENLPPRAKRIEIYLSQKAPVRLTGLRIAKSAGFSIPSQCGLRWITYGSSITQCASAASPAQTWPALVARRRNLDLMCLGYGGNCHIEPMVARMIRDLPADIISVCLGINVMGQNSLSARTFRPAVIGLLSIIREKRPETPLAVLSPIYCPHRETTPNTVGLTLVKMREEIELAVQALQAHGDRHIIYQSGLDIFNAGDQAHLPDNLHPDAVGYRIMAERFDQLVMSRLLAMLPGAQ